MNGTWVTVALVCIGLAGSVMLLAQTDGPQYGGRYTEERIANLRANVEEYDWAAAQRDAAIDAAKKWVQRSDDQLWRMIPFSAAPPLHRYDDDQRRGRCCGAEDTRLSRVRREADEARELPVQPEHRRPAMEADLPELQGCHADE